MSRDGGLEKSLRDWLESGGYPLEMRVARSVRHHGAFPDHARFFEDSLSSKIREIDVVAYFDNDSGPSVHLVIECKSSRDKPWVIFCSDEPIRMPRAAISEAPATPKAVPVLRRSADDHILAGLSPFRASGRTGYAVATGLRRPRDGGDPAFGAVRAVTAAAMAVAERIGRSNHSVVFPPVIVLDAPLFSCHLPRDTDEPILERVDWRLLWQPTVEGLRPVNITTESALDDLLASTGVATDRLATLAPDDRGDTNED